MKWLKFEPQEEELSDPETSTVLVYLGPEALKHAVIVDDFTSFQDSPECIPGGRLLEVSRQYSYRLRQVADLVEEPLEDHKPRMKPQPKRNFQAEIRPEKHLDKNEDNLMIGGSDSSYTESSSVDASDTEGNNEPQHKVGPDEVPFKDLYSVLVN